jgi:hypothetical protein
MAKDQEMKMMEVMAIWNDPKPESSAKRRNTALASKGFELKGEKTHGASEELK